MYLATPLWDSVLMTNARGESSPRRFESAERPVDGGVLLLIASHGAYTEPPKMISHLIHTLTTKRDRIFLSYHAKVLP